MIWTLLFGFCFINLKLPFPKFSLFPSRSTFFHQVGTSFHQPLLFSHQFGSTNNIYFLLITSFLEKPLNETTDISLSEPINKLYTLHQLHIYVSLTVISDMYKNPSHILKDSLYGTLSMLHTIIRSYGFCKMHCDTFV